MMWHSLLHSTGNNEIVNVRILLLHTQFLINKWSIFDIFDIIFLLSEVYLLVSINPLYGITIYITYIIRPCFIYAAL